MELYQDTGQMRQSLAACPGNHALPAVKVIEHPDIFVEHSEYSMDDFDYIIELRNNPEEEITYEVVEKNNFFNEPGFGFDF